MGRRESWRRRKRKSKELAPEVVLMVTPLPKEEAEEAFGWW